MFITNIYNSVDTIKIICLNLSHQFTWVLQMSNMDSPKPFYYEDLEEGYSLFVDGSPEWFWSFEELESYVSDMHVPYQLILVDLGNWQFLLDSGAFDA